MACITAPTAILGAGALSAGGSLLSSSISSGAASTASKQQAATAEKALDLQSNEFNTIEQQLSPYINTGTTTLSELSNLLQPGGTLTTPISTSSGIQTSFNPTMQALAQTPGYQFTLQQGLKGVQNQLASQGLGASGPAAAAAAQYAGGAASTTFQNQYTNWLNTQNLGLQNFLGQSNLNLQQKQLIYNMLAGPSQLGEAAAAGSASAGTTITGQQSNTLSSLGASQAAGTVGSANALTSGLTGVSNAGLNTATLLALTGGFGGSTGSTVASALPGVNLDTTSTTFGRTS